MVTLCINYIIDQNQFANFEEYARSLSGPIERCGGKLIGYFLPTKLAGPTNEALALIDFENLASYEKYRAALMKDPESIASVRKIEKSGCILSENRSFLQRVS
jgi:hypothetical protein